MDYFQAEEKLQKINELISKEKSSRFLLAKILQYILEITEDNDIIEKEAFVSELLGKTNLLLQKFSAFGLEPQSTEEILDALKIITNAEVCSEYVSEWGNEITRIMTELDLLKFILDGKKIQSNLKNKFFFPVLEKTSAFDFSYSLIDSLEISLLTNKSKQITEFITYPSAVDVEERIKNQIHVSWEYAKNYIIETYNRQLPFFEVIIKFEKSYAIYEGSSLGIALTIGFISELMKYFDFRDNLNFAQHIISSGAVVESGETLSMTKEIICTKLKAVFFSQFSIFIIPQNDDQVAYECLEKLKQKYPKRDLEIIGVKNIDDIINRRNLIELKKTNLISWSTRKVLKNKITVLSLILSTLLLFMIYFWRMDDNPVKTEFKDNHINVLNKYGEVLWRKKFNYSDKTINNYPSYIKQKTRIIDIDNDGINEVLIANVDDRNKLNLFSYYGEVIWTYEHKDEIRTKNEIMEGTYNVQGIIDTIITNDKIELLIYIQHYSYYPSGILKLDLETGKQISDILWHPGSITSSILIDWNQDGIKEIIAGGPSNGMKKAYIFSIDHNRLRGTFPTSEDYFFKDLSLAKFNKYLLFPMTDYGKKYFPKYNAVVGNPAVTNNLLSFRIPEGRANLYEEFFNYGVRINENFEVENIIIGDEVIVRRDSLINAGVLYPPYTDTPEFHNSILYNIEYWNGSEFVKLFKEDHK